MTDAPASVHELGERRRLSYGLLRAWARTAVCVFYRRVDLEGREHLPAGHPTIFAANHSNALGDVAVILAKVGGFPHFLATSAWWKRRSARILFNLGGVLPVQRSGDAPGPLDNLRTFDACYRALGENASLAIFPEGVMHLDPTVRPLKTGAARIGLGAADLGVQGVVIVPLGLVYEDRGRFRSYTTLRFGPPIAMTDWLERYADDERGTVGAVTQHLARELTRLTTPRPPRDEPDGGARSRAVRELAILSPAAAAGVLANAPVLIVGVLGRYVHDEMWQASIKAVAATALLLLTWGTELVLLSRCYGVRRASVLTSAGAASGLATVAWLDRQRDLTVRARSSRATPTATAIAIGP